MAGDEDEKPKLYGYSFGDLRLYPKERLLLRGNETVEHTGSLFNILHFVVVNTGRVLSKKQIADGALAGINIDNTTISTYIGKIRRIIGDRGAIKTIVKQGYQPTMKVSGLTEPPPLPGASATKPLINLPPRGAGLVGREDDLAALEKFVRQHRLTALVGPSGVGKTRLAGEFGWQVSKYFPGGVVYVDLSPATDAASAISALARALGLPLHAADAPLDAIAEAIRERPMLMIADGCEHLGSVIVDIIRVLQARAPDLTILATSQHVLDGIVHEVCWLAGLALPPDGPIGAQQSLEYGAVKVFTDYARSGDQRFIYDDEIAVDAVAICRLLDGIPLSLQIIATHVHFNGMAKLRRHLEQRVELLRIGAGTPIKRHCSPLDMVEWGYDRLDAEEQQFFCRLGIFPNWFTAEEALAVAGETKPSHDLLRALVNKSMVIRQDGKVPLYRLLGIQRAYAQEQLEKGGEFRMMARRHLDCFKDLIARDEAAWETLPDRQLRQIYAPHLDNLRMALETALAERELVPSGITLLGMSGRLWSILRLIPEGQGFFDRYMPFVGKDTPLADAARFLRFAGILCRHADRKRTVTLLKQSVTLYRKLKDWLSLGAVLALLGGEYLYLGRYDDAKATLDEALKHLSSSDHLKSLQDVMNNSGSLALALNDLTEAARCLGLARDLASEMGDLLRENIVLYNLGELEARRDALVIASDYAQQAANGLLAAGEMSYRARALTNLGAYLTLCGEHAEARHHALDGLELLIQEGGRGRLVRLQLCGVAAIFAGDYGWGVRLVGHAKAEHARTGEVPGPTEQRLVDQALAFAATRRKPDEIAAWLADGAQWPVERAVALIRNKIVPLLTASAESDDAADPQGDKPAGRAKSTRSGD